MHPSALQPDPQGEEATLAAGLQALPILDAAGAIALMDSSLDLYLEIAQAYRNELPGLAASIDAAVQSTNLSDACRTLHTFKGLSLTVGAQRISEVCKRCELLLKHPSPGPAGLDLSTREAIGTALRENVHITSAALDDFLNQPSQAPAQPGVAPNLSAQPSSVINGLHDLRELLARSDLAALDVFANLQARHGEIAVHLEGLGTALKAFDFSQAMVQCNELIHKLSLQRRT